MEKMKQSWSVVTVKIAVIAVVIALVSIFLPWFSRDNMSQTLKQAVDADPEFYVGILPAIVVGAIWIVLCFLLNHPKLTLVGTVVMAFCGLAVVVLAMGWNLSLGLGTWFYLLAVVVCVVCAFATKKIRK